MSILENSFACNPHRFQIVTDSNGEVLGIQVKRGMGVTYYHRTSRGAKELFDLKSGEFKGLFLSTKQFLNFSKNKNILDLGCGSGALVRDLRASSVSIVGVDLYLDQAQKKCSDFKIGDAFSLPFPGQSFNLILSSYSVFHYESPSQFRVLLSEAKRVLGFDGSLCLSTMDDLERLIYLKKTAESLNLKIDIHWNSRTCKITKN